ncbi:MAG: ABC transporter permease [Candidatus Paracaedibacteraceae bacterium]|nr:ABC transporter permease [Candidatus Paracaedibacteraceae bacterium]
MTLSWIRLKALLIKEFLQLSRDKLTLAFILIMPIMQLILFGYALNTDPKDLPLIVIDQNKSSFSRNLIHQLETSNYFKVLNQSYGEKEAITAMIEGKSLFILNIPSTFSQDLIRNQKPAILLTVDATDPVTSANALAVAQVLKYTGLPHDFTGPLTYLAPREPAYDIIVHKNYNPEGITSYNIIPGLMGTILTLTMVVVTGMVVTREKEKGTYEQLLSMPVNSLEVMLGKVLPFVLVGYAQIAVILIASKLLFDIPFLGSLFLLFMTVTLFAGANLMVGYLFSSISNSQMQATQMSVFFFLPSILLSGFMFPFQGMPYFAQVIGEFLPLTHFVRAARGIMLKDAQFGHIYIELAKILIFLLISGWVALKKYRSTLD